MVPDYPNPLELSYPTHCLFGHILDGSDLLDNVDSSKEISNPTYTYADICNPLKKPRSGVSASKQSTIRISKKVNQHKKAKVNFSKDTKTVQKSRSGILKSRSGIPKSRSDILTSRIGKPQRIRSESGHPKNRLYIYSGASVHILFN